MINKDRIVPVQATDLITLYATMLKMSGTSLTVVSATDANGDFELATAPQSGSIIANEPVSTFDFASGVSAATVYFVPAYDYAGFTADGEAISASGEVEADGCTLYLATLASNAVTIAKVSY